MLRVTPYPSRHDRAKRWRCREKLIFVLISAVGLLVGNPARRSSASNPSEYEVKAAYLYNLGRFVEWPQDVPAGQANEFAICVLGRDPFGSALDSTISGESIDGKRVVARRISKVDAAPGCRVLFISSSENTRLNEILAAVSRESVLTVSDFPHFLQQGGMVQFVLLEERVRFEVNLAAAEQARLSLSSELLKVAADVKGRPRPRT